MSTRPALYRNHRFPPQIISHAVWLYHRFSLSFRDVEDLLAQRFLSVHGIVQNPSRVGRHLLHAANARILRTRALRIWTEVTCA